MDGEVAGGRFRQDLLFRLNTIEINIPPLRERREDITLLAAIFLRQHAQHYRKKIVGFEEEALRSLMDFPWPGNIRELDHSLERAVLMARSEKIKAADLGLRAASIEGETRLEDMNLEEVERYLIRKTLARSNGNVSQAAKCLGLSRSALYRRLERYRLF